MIDKNLCNTFTTEGFENKNVENINNTEEEIKEFAIEALNILAVKIQYWQQYCIVLA